MALYMKVCLVAAGLIALLDTVFAQNTRGKVTFSPACDKFVVGSKVTMVCKMDNDADVPAGNVVWKTQGNKLSSGGTIEIAGVNAQELKITAVALTDSYKSYTCTPNGRSESTSVSFSVETPRKPLIHCFPESIQVNSLTKCICAHQNRHERCGPVPQEYLFKVDGISKTAQGGYTCACNIPPIPNEVTFGGTMALNGKDVTCAVKFNDNTEGTSPEETTKLRIYDSPICTTPPTNAAGCDSGAGMSLMTIGFVLLLSTLLVKE